MAEVGLPQNAISTLVKGEREFSLRLLERVAEHMGVLEWELLRDMQTAGRADSATQMDSDSATQRRFDTAIASLSPRRQRQLLATLAGLQKLGLLDAVLDLMTALLAHGVRDAIPEIVRLLHDEASANPENAEQRRVREKAADTALA